SHNHRTHDRAPVFALGRTQTNRHFLSLNIAGGNIVQDSETKNMLMYILGLDVFPVTANHYSKLQLIIELLRIIWPWNDFILTDEAGVSTFVVSRDFIPCSWYFFF